MGIFMAVSTLPHLALVAFLEHLEVERNVSRLTIRNYRLYLRRFCDWFQSTGNTDLSELDQEKCGSTVYICHNTVINMVEPYLREPRVIT